MSVLTAEKALPTTGRNAAVAAGKDGLVMMDVDNIIGFVISSCDKKKGKVKGKDMKGKKGTEKDSKGKSAEEAATAAETAAATAKTGWAASGKRACHGCGSPDTSDRIATASSCIKLSKKSR